MAPSDQPKVLHDWSPETSALSKGKLFPGRAHFVPIEDDPLADAIDGELPSRHDEPPSDDGAES